MDIRISEREFVNKMNENIISKPFLKWAGAKTQIIPLLLSHFENKTRLVEPFVGSGAVFLGTNYETYLLNDNNPDLIELFTFLRDECEELISQCSNLFVDKFNDEEQFYKLRTEFNDTNIKSIRKSAIFVYLNRHCFNGLCRYNAKGKFNVPFGRYKKVNLQEEAMRLFSAKAEKCIFTNNDFYSLEEEITLNDIVYCDPPYLPISKSANFTAYSKSFNLTDQERLVEFALRLISKGAKVVISNHDTDEARELYKDANIFSIDVRRNISSKKETRGNVKEIIAVFE